MADDYAKAIKDADARRAAQRAVRAAQEQRQTACVQFFKSIEMGLAAEMEKANPALERGQFAERFSGPHAAEPPDCRMMLGFGGTSNKREIVLDMQDETKPTVCVLEPENGGAVALQYLLEDKGAGLRAYSTEGSGVADWRTDFTPVAVARRIVESVIDGLCR
jgi:hypothetical protein